MFFSLWRRLDRLPVALAALCTALSVPAMAQPLTLQQAVAQAAGQSGMVSAADAQARSAQERVVAAGQRPDPVLKLGINNLPVDGPDRFSTTRDFMTMRSVSLMQELTREDKRQARTERAQQQVEAARIARQAVQAEIQRDAALAWLDRSFRESARELIQAQVAQAQLQAEAARTLYRAGKTSQADVFAVRSAVEQLRDALALAEREIGVAGTQLARWLPGGAQLPLAARPPLQLPAWTQGELGPHLAAHPQIAAASQQEALAGSEAALARAQKSADWTVELMYSQRGPDYSNMVSVNLSVPLQWEASQRQDRELAARMIEVDEARARREDLLRSHEAEVRAMLQTWHGDGERLRRYDASLLPLANQRSQAALAAYRAGSASLGAVLEARQSELEVRLARLRIEAQRARIWAQLNFLLPSGEDGSLLEATP